MKFTNGYWMLKPEFDFGFAVEYYRSKITKDRVEILCPGVSIRERGDTLSGPVLTVAFSAPMENVLRVNIRHFTGVQEQGPEYELTEEPVKPLIEENEQELTIQSGKLTATVC